jgi:hypothetical protein
METNGSKKIKVVLNDGFEICGEFDSMMTYNVSLYAEELNTGQLNALYTHDVSVSKSLRGYFVIVRKNLIKEVNFHE